MALKPCRECGEDISTEAKTCPHCGVASPARGKGLAWPVAILLILLLLWFVDAKDRNAAPKLSSQQVADRNVADAAESKEFAAEAFCKEAALQLLKSPATAQWGDESDNYRHTDSPGRWHIQLQVDAENSFGALMRTTVDCKVAERNGTLRLASIKSWGR